MKEWKAAERVTQKMTRDGAITVNLVTGEATRISERAEEQDFSASSRAGQLVGDLVQRGENHHINRLERQNKRNRRRGFREGQAAEARASSRLPFSEEDRAAPELQKAIQKSDKAADRLDTAKENLPVKLPVQKKNNQLLKRPMQEVGNLLHSKIREVEQDNSGVQAGHLAERAVEQGLARGALRMESIRAEQQLKPWRDVQRAEQAAMKANANYYYQKTVLENPQAGAGNPLSREAQKKKLQRQYAKSYRSGQSPAQAGETARRTAEQSARAARRTAEGVKSAVSFVSQHWKGCLVVVGVLFVSVFLIGGVSSFVSLLGSGISNLASNTYFSEDADLIAAEDGYLSLENALQVRLDTYEDFRSYDEYRYTLDAIGHDPYVLLSILSALHEGMFTAEQVQSDLALLFARQYTLTEDVSSEIRYRPDGDGGLEEYTWTVCTVTLDSLSLETVAAEVLTAEQVEMYEAYMAALGNREDLYPDSVYNRTGEGR